MNEYALKSATAGSPGKDGGQSTSADGRQRGNALANQGYDPDEARLPPGQAGGGQWTSSVLVLSGVTGRLKPVLTPEKKQAAGEGDLEHDNSGGRPGVVIYTSDKDTYDRYTTTQSKTGQLASAYVVYVGSPDSPNNAGLASGNPANASPSINGVTYGNRVTINPSESWHYYDPKDARKKAEERAFIGISSHIPTLVGFSPAAGGGGAVVEGGAAAMGGAAAPVDAGIPWGTGIEAQGRAWEDHLEGEMPAGSRLPPRFKTFDFFDRATGTATSAKTLQTMTRVRMANPSQLYNSLVKNIDAAADFTDYIIGTETVESNEIESRVLQVAIQNKTTPEQMEQINRAIRYGKERGVTVIITKTK